MSDIRYGTPTEHQLTLINKMALRPLEADEVFAFKGKSAGDMMIPGRHTRIGRDLLAVLVDDARKGVSFMLNHNWGFLSGGKGIPYGKVFDGDIVESGEGGENHELYLSKYIVRDDETVDGISANALIKRIETGVMSDTSIAFNTDIMTCSICNENYFGSKCGHYRGNTYEMGDGTQKVCTVTAMPPSIILPQNNNALMEESIVWDGAYPGAIVTQSSAGDIVELEGGEFFVLGEKDELPDGTAFVNQYHNGDMVTLVKKSEPKLVISMGSPKEPKDDILSDEPKGVEQSVNENLKKVLEALGVEVEGETMTDEVMDTLATAIEELQAENEALTASVSEEDEVVEYLSEEQAKEALGDDVTAETVLELAREGQAYKAKLIGDTIAMGVRAMGNDFKSETWEGTLAALDTESINDIMGNWSKQAGEEIPAGRKTPLEAEEGKKLSQLPDEAFR